MLRALLKRRQVGLIGKFWWLSFAVVILATCDSATKGDREALHKVQERWGDKYDFKLSSDTYWTARAKPSVTIDEKELQAAVSLFSRRTSVQPSAFVYLNVYDHTGHFVFQLYQNPSGDIVKDTRSEHY
jgi:hypothetical protein